jgi:hypothetical protein
MSNLHTLVYLSTATRLFTDDDLKHILQVSRSNNTEKNMSGILVYCEGNILQVLEGEETAINILYKRIELDQRHSGMIVLQNRAIEKRNFTDWSMGFKSASKEEFVQLEGYFDLKRNFTFEGGTPSAIKGILKDFLRNNG